MKNKRQSKILNIVQTKPMRTHDELIDALKAEGVNVTQATVSRDIKELGIIKVPTSDGGSVYSVPQMGTDSGKNRVGIISDSVKRVSSALHTIVINTFPGMAPAVASVVDSMYDRQVLGSVAGDDTVIIITPSEDDAQKLEKEMKESFRLDL